MTMNANIFVAWRKRDLQGQSGILICLWVYDWSIENYKRALDHAKDCDEGTRVFMLPKDMPYAAQKKWIASHF
jgi:hypothetical protein